MTTPDLLVALTGVVGLVIAVRAAWIDAGTHRLPNPLTASLAAVALVGAVAVQASGGRPIPLGALAGGAALYAGPWLVSHLISPASVGFGDVKLSAGLGLYLGWFDPWSAAGAILVAGVVFLPYRWFDRRRGGDGLTPFGPALVLGAVVLVVLGAASAGLRSGEPGPDGSGSGSVTESVRSHREAGIGVDDGPLV